MKSSKNTPKSAPTTPEDAKRAAALEAGVSQAPAGEELPAQLTQALVPTEPMWPAVDLTPAHARASDALMGMHQLTAIQVLDHALVGYTTEDGRRGMRSVARKVAGWLFAAPLDAAPWGYLAAGAGPDACRHLRQKMKESVRLADNQRGRVVPDCEERGISRSSANMGLVFLRRVLSVLRQGGLMDGHHLHLCRSELKSLKTVTPNQELKIRELDLATLQASFVSLPEEMRARETLVLCLLSCGLRRAEVAGMRWGDVQYGNGTAELMVCGKGDKWRSVPLIPLAVDVLARWAFFCESDLGEDSIGDGEPILRRVRQDGTILLPGVSGDGLYRTMRQRLKKAGLEQVGMHEFRRLFVTTLLDNGVPITVAADLAGHASVNTTMGYARHGQVARQQAMAQAPNPLKGSSMDASAPTAPMERV
jgi:integrase